jgi:hypothetical protein
MYCDTIFVMEQTPRAITWEAPEYVYNEKRADWYVVLVIIFGSLVVASVLFNNVLFALLVGVAGGALAVSAARKPRVISFAVSVRGVMIDDQLFPYSTLKAYHVDEDHEHGPKLLVLSKRRFTPIFVIPIPKEYIDDIEEIMVGKLEEKLLQEPLMFKVLEKFGF